MMVRRDRPAGTPTEPELADHIPVLLAEVLASLTPSDHEVYVDGTFGAGGYTRAILEAADCRVIAIDRDPEAVRRARMLAEEFAGRLTVVEAPFSTLDTVARDAGAAAVDGVVLDIGVSSMQLDTPERGFSFQTDGPLDMRMAQHGTTAADVVNTAEESQLADILYHLGEERRSRAVARAIVSARADSPFQTTKQLADVVSRVLGGRKIDGRHPATRTFQALRIYVNDELGELVSALGAAERCLKPGGRLVVVTFHSLEDRIVKRFLSERSGKEARGSRHLPEQSVKSAAPSFRIINQRPLTASKGELEVNPRARSARVRAAVRTEAAAWPLDQLAAGLPPV
jgi:16S rRNA (cytosine1402-N4)-methyltransferase